MASSTASTLLKKCVFFMLATLFGMGPLVNVANGQHDLPVIPKNAVFVAHIRSPQNIFSELKFLKNKAISDVKLDDIVNGKPFPLGGDGWDQDVDILFNSLDEFIGRVHSATLITTSIEPELEYAIIVNLNEESSPELPDLGKQTIKLLDSILQKDPEKKEAPKKAADSPNYTRLLNRIARENLPGEFRKEGKVIYLSNSQSLLDWLFNNRDKKTNRTKQLANDRRFQRSIAGLDSADDCEIFFYSIPQLIFPLWDEKYDKEYLQKYGFEEMVGAAASVDLGVKSSKSGDHQIICRMSVPYTVPESDVVAMWKTYKTIKFMPRIAKFVSELEEQPTRIMLTSYDRAEQFKVREEIYRAKGELAELEKKYESAIGKRGFSFDVHRDFTDGTTLQLWTAAQLPVQRRYSLIFQGVLSPDVTREWVEKSIDAGNSSGSRPDPNPRVHQNIGGYDGWFMKDKHARRQLKLDYGNDVEISDRHSERNAGMVIAGKWLMFGEKWMIDEYFSNGRMKNANPADELEQLFPGVHELVTNFRPASLDFRFPGQRISGVIDSYRVSTLGQRGDRVSPRKRSRRLDYRKPLIEELNVESTSDRLVALGEWCLRHSMQRYPRDVRAFACRDGSFEWEWRLIRENDTLLFQSN